MAEKHLNKTSPVEEGVSKEEIKDAIFKGRFKKLVRRRLRQTN